MSASLIGLRLDACRAGINVTDIVELPSRIQRAELRLRLIERRKEQDRYPRGYLRWLAYRAQRGKRKVA